MKLKHVAISAFLLGFVFLVNCMAYAQDEKPKGVGRIGLGIPYGILGLNYEHPFNDMISLQGGLGFSPGGAGWAAGAKVYAMKNTGRNIRLYLSTVYGTTTFLEKRGTSSGWDSKSGATAGLGFGKRSWQVEFLYVFTKLSDAEKAGRKEVGGNVKLAVGWAIF